MAKKSQQSKQHESALLLTDLVALFLAVWFVSTVITNSLDLIRQGAKNSPAFWAVLLSLALVGWSFYQRKNKLSSLALVTLTVAVTSGAIWFLGVHQ